MTRNCSAQCAPSGASGGVKLPAPVITFMLASPGETMPASLGETIPVQARDSRGAWGR